MAYESALDEVLKPLLKQEAELLETLQRVRGAIASIRGVADAPMPSVDEIVSQAKEQPLVNPFEGMTQPEMTYETIKRNGKPMLAREIYEVWKVHGVEPVGSDAVSKIQMAVKRREAKVGDVVHVGDGKWGICSWYAANEIERFRRDGTFHARDTEQHRKKMIQGIKAAKAKGAHYGGPPKITPEQWELAVKLYREGAKSVSAVHREIIKLTPEGDKPMVSNTLRKWVDDIKDGKPYPERWARYMASKKSEDTDPMPNLRVAK